MNKKITINGPLQSQSDFLSFSIVIKRDYLFIIIAFIISIFIHIFLWIAYPYHFGPDGQMYIMYFLDIFSSRNLFPYFLTYVMPIAPFFYGLILKTGSVIFLTIITELVALSCVPMIYFIFNSWGKNVSRAATLFLVFLIPYQIQFHQIYSDALFSWAVLLYFVVYIYLINLKNMKFSIVIGVVIAFCILIRQIGVVLILPLFFLWFSKTAIKKMIKLTCISILCILVSLCPFLGYKYFKFKDFSISRGSNYLEFSRVYTLQDPILDSVNGKYSEKLIKIIKDNILSTDLYKKYNISLDQFLKYQPNRRFFHDIIFMVDRIEGWDTDYKLLRQVAVESIKADPFSYIRNYLEDIIKMLINSQQTQSKPVPIGNIDFTSAFPNPERVYPEEISEGELIPFSYIWWGLTRPDNNLPTIEELKSFSARFDNLTKNISSANGSEKFQKYFSVLWANINIPIIYFWVLSVVGIFLSEKRQKPLIIGIFLITVSSLIISVYGNAAYMRYRLPFEPLIISAGIAGFKELLNLRNIRALDNKL